MKFTATFESDPKYGENGHPNEWRATLSGDLVGVATGPLQGLLNRIAEATQSPFRRPSWTTEAVPAERSENA